MAQNPGSPSNTIAASNCAADIASCYKLVPAPSFAEISRGDTHIYLTEPFRVGGGAPMPSGEQQVPGGWNRIHLVVADLDATVAKLREEGCRFRNAVVQGVGGKQILLEDPSGNLVELFQPNTAAYRPPGSGQKGQ